MYRRILASSAWTGAQDNADNLVCTSWHTERISELLCTVREIRYASLMLEVPPVLSHGWGRASYIVQRQGGSRIVEYCLRASGLVPGLVGRASAATEASSRTPDHGIKMRCERHSENQVIGEAAFCKPHTELHFVHLGIALIMSC